MPIYHINLFVHCFIIFIGFIIRTFTVAADDPPSVDVVDSDDEEGPDDVSLSTGRLVSMETRRLEQHHTKRYI